MKPTILLGALLVLLTSLFAPAAVRLVPDQYLTIQQAIDDCNAGDTVVIAPGTYTGDGNRDLEFHGKAITVTSTNPHNPGIVAATVIDCEGSRVDKHRAFRFVLAEGPNSVVTGLTLTNGYAPGEGEYQDWYYGGAIYCADSSPTITYCAITGNATDDSYRTKGGGIYCSNGHPTITHCTITANVVDSYSSSYGDGGGIFCANSSSPTISHCIVANNSADHGGGIYASYNSNPIITNTILWGNTAPDGPQILVSSSSHLAVSYSDVQDGLAAASAESDPELTWGPGNINVDPRFVDPNAGDYHLALDSLCINAGDPNFIPSEDQRDIDGQERVINGRLDIGPDEVDYYGPLIGINPTKCLFDANEGGPNPYPQGFSVYNSGPGMVNWEIDYDCNWLDVSPTSGTSAGESDEVILSVDVNGMRLGLYHTTLIIRDDDGASSPQVFEVTLHIYGMKVHVPAELPTIRGGIDHVLEGGTVIVADGIYTGDGNRDIDFKGKAITLRSENGPDNCVIDCNATYEEQHRGLYFHSGEDSESVLKGFTITGGQAPVSAFYVGHGGAIFCDESSPTIANCVIMNNESARGRNGGGVCCYQSNAVIKHCEISNNIAYGVVICGGALVGGEGGGIHCYGGSPKIIDCTITKNRSAHGGGIYCRSTTAEITNSRIIENRAIDDGGGLSCHAGAPLIMNSLIAGNEGHEWHGGGGLCCWQGNPLIINCTITGNLHRGRGGGVFCSKAGNPTIINSIVWGNTASYGGDELYLATSDYWGGHLYSTITFAYSNIRAQRGNGRAQRVNGRAQHITTHVDPGCALNWQIGNINTNPDFIQPGYWDANGTSHTTRDDFWVNGDYHLKSNGWRWDAQRKDWTWDEITSRCIDAGDPGSPLGDEPLSVPADANNEWGQNLRVNMGAYGGTAEASMPPYGWAIRSDYNNDGIANFTDLACWSIYHGYILPEPPDDSSPSPTLNSADLALVADRWLDQTTWFTTPSPASSLPPNAASYPNPPDGSVGIRLAPVLSWQGGFDAVSHDIYFGTANPPPFQTNQPGRTFEPGPLSPLTAYYWRIDEVKPYGTTVGPVWTFTTSSAGGR